MYMTKQEFLFGGVKKSIISTYKSYSQHLLSNIHGNFCHLAALFYLARFKSTRIGIHLITICSIVQIRFKNLSIIKISCLPYFS